MRNPLIPLILAVLAAIGSLTGADPVITTGSVLVALLRFARDRQVARRYVLPVHQAPARRRFAPAR